MKKTKPQFSPRETEVVALVLRGQSNKQIASALNISIRTVEFHLQNIYAKQQVSSRVELILALNKAAWARNQCKPVESTVASVSEEVHNGNLGDLGRRWQTALETTYPLIQKEIAMTTIVLMEKLGNLVQKHPLFLSILLLATASFITRYLLISLGLYFWFSYLLLALMLSFGSVYLGVSLQQNRLVGRSSFYRLMVLGVALLPVTIILLDMGLLHSVAKVTGAVSTELASISNQAFWLRAPDGQLYLYRERFIGSDHLWLVATLYTFVLFGLSVYVQEIKRNRAAVA